MSTDIYTTPEAIVRELVKNSYDAYLKVAPDDFQDEALPRKIVIRRERDANGVGRLYISDRAIGQGIDDIKANVQISISTKKEELSYATGFRGLGSWSVLGAGSRITITSKRRTRNHPVSSSTSGKSTSG